MASFRLGDEPDIVATIVDETDTVIDISSATSMKLDFLTPLGDVETFAASLKNSGTDGKLHYQTTSTFMPLADREKSVGLWKYQGRCVIGSHPYTSTWAEFIVEDVFRRT